MSLQDDIFDVQAALDGKPEAEAFEEICKALGRFEVKADSYGKMLHDLSIGLRAFRLIWDASWRG